MQRSKKARWPSRWRIVLAVLLFLLGTGMMLWPRIQSWQQTQVVNEGVQAFREQFPAFAVPSQPQESLPTTTNPSIPIPDATDPVESIPYAELLAAMEAYNRDIYESGQSGLVDAWSYQSEVFDLSQYSIADNVAGVISIPAIDVEMPLYLGASEEHLALGFAQLSQTSMPIGGVDTNCVVAGHRGWNGAAYMRDADKLEIGDTVYLQNFWDTLEYQVCEMVVIEPNETSRILIQPGRDLLTIVTCTPYGVGSHRLLIICERVK